MKKTVLIFTFFLIFCGSLYSQIPQTISWQGILQDADSKNLSGTYSLTVKLYDVATGGTAIWSETHSNVVIVDGLVNLTLGSVTPFSINFADEYWLEITVGSGSPLPRIKLSSVPYALHSKTAESANETDPQFSASPASGILNTDITNWNTAYSWGNHADEGYLTEYSETDPLFSASPASGILNTDITNWNTAYSWGNHADEGYLTEYSESDPTWDNGGNVSNNIGRLGNVGIGIYTPTALLHTHGLGDGEGNVLHVGVFKDTPGDPPTLGAGTRMMWYPDKAAFRAGSVTGTQWDKDNIGKFSVAIGSNTIASGDFSSAMGINTTASGNSSTALGWYSTASGYSATAIGSSTDASGSKSIALGSETTAKSGFETVIGRFNTDYTPNSITDWSETDRLFVIGNGTANDSRKDALTVLKNGNLGIGTSTPTALLHTNGIGTGEGSVLHVGVFKDTPGDPPTSEGSTRMMWYPDKAAFRVGSVTGTQWNKDNIGNYSVAMGYNTKASGNHSTALGWNTTSSGHYSTSLGAGTTASGNYTTAMGVSAMALGYYSTALGFGVSSPSAYETVIGAFNTTYTPTSVSSWHSTDRLFVIGNGTPGGPRTDAMVVLKNGSTGIGTSTPTALLHTNGTGTDEGNILFVGEYKSTDPGDPPASGAGTRMMWYPDKAAFRAGAVIGVQWDKANIGIHSVAMGYNNTASGDYSIAMGHSTYAYGDYSTATGSNSDAAGDYSTAIGYANTASGGISTAMGGNTIASGDVSTAMGGGTTASSTFSTAMGENSTASGYASTAMGSNTKARSGYETVLGRWNVDYTPSTPSAWHVNDRLFVIGNGTGSTSRSNAMTILKNGRIGIGTATPAALLHITDTDEGNILFEGEFKGSGPSDPPTSGAGTRMMWYPDKASFRVGRVSSTQWDKDSIGDYSVAMGYNTKALNVYSTALGYSTIASGSISTALGNSSKASGYNSLAMGYSTIASGYISTAMGIYSESSGDYSFVLGNQIQSPSAYETVIGRYNTTYTPSSGVSWNVNDRLFVIGNGTGNSTRSNALTVLKNGRVGIGTDSPSAGLHLKGSSHPSSFIYLESDLDEDAGLRFYEGDTTKWHIFNNSSAAGLSIYNSAYSVALFAKQSNAYIGIGTSSPSQRLDVNGNARFRSISSGAYAGVVNRTSDGTLTTATSDIRFKENIETLENSLERVMQLRGVSFTWKSNPEYGTRIGFIAQEFENVMPELSFTNPADGYMGINYAEMTAVLAEAIKEQQQLIESQNTKIDELERKLEQLLIKFSENK
ncbi:MAG: tail fiber domain-containing protein [Candidatus Kapabacteria bacterium]|nr:tail fiber domain-containing protein [Candidatus Kapabacteria bacterium]